MSTSTDLAALERMTVVERVEFIQAFNAMKDALAIEPSYERALAIQTASRLVAKVRRVLAEARFRPPPALGGAHGDDDLPF